jgi:hypothetical protein
MQAKQGACSLTSPACKSAKAMAMSKADCGVLHRVLVPPALSSIVFRFSVQLYQSGCSDSSQRGCNGLAAMTVAGGL